MSQSVVPDSNQERKGEDRSAEEPGAHKDHVEHRGTRVLPVCIRHIDLVGDERGVRDGAVTRVEATAFRWWVETDAVYMCYRSSFSFLVSRNARPEGVIGTRL